jgi:MEDS: MEthanogen/methylotroph, DcmR Sensory domain
MTPAPHQVSLGFTPQAFPAGIHVCQIFADDEERLSSLCDFLSSGLTAGERAACFSGRFDEMRLSRHLHAHGLSLRELTESGAFSFTPADQAYFHDGRFDPDRMVEALRAYHDEALALGYPAARVIGEMAPEVQAIAGGSRLMEYESRVSILLRDHPVTAVCQYDANRFDGATIMQVLKVHPLMVIRGTVVHNPYYVSPEEVLAHCC